MMARDRMNPQVSLVASAPSLLDSEPRQLARRG
jgi:hypothetical protein